MATGRNLLSSDAPRYRFGVFEADAGIGELRRDGVKVKLQEQPFQILLAMLERPGNVVTREELIQRLWPPDTFVDFDHSLNVAIKKLREALRDDADNPRFIETKPRRGYRFIAPVQTVEADTSNVGLPPEASAPGTNVVTGPQIPSRRWTRTLFALIQLMYLCFYIIALVRFRHIDEAAGPFFGSWTFIVTSLVIITAMLGIAIRLYLLSAVLFDYTHTGEKFLRIFPAILVLDTIWALSPFLAAVDIGIGLALAVTAALIYLPFSQRTLIRMAYPQI
jgi:DNA-binding winged helix-turn-helix (wHTH) protein